MSSAHCLRTKVLSAFSAFVLMALAASCSTTDSTLPTPAEPWQGLLPEGRYEVGFRSETLPRTTADGSSRSLILSVWYPAVSGTGQQVRVADLFQLVLSEAQLDEPNGLPAARGLSAAMTGDADALLMESAEEALAMPTSSRLDAERAPGNFPLVLWSSRHATVLAQAPLSEALASHGSVVATVWSSDPPLAFLWEDRPESEKLATIDVQTDDLQHSLSILRSRGGVDPDRTVVLSWSYGGQTAARLQERDDGILGIVGLDANVVPARPEERLELRVPLIWLLGRDSSGRGLETASDLTAPTLVVGLPELAHGNFNALEGFLPGMFGAETVFPWSTGGQVAVDGYTALVRIGIESVHALANLHVESESSLDGLWDRVAVAAGDVPVELVHDGLSQSR